MKQFWSVLLISLFSVTLIAMDDTSNLGYWFRLKAEASQKLGSEITRQRSFIDIIDRDIEFCEQRCELQPNSGFCEMLALLCYMRQQELQKLQQRQTRYCNLTGKCDSYKKS